MDKLELLYQLLKEVVNDIDNLEDKNKNDFVLGLRMGYLQCIGVISDIKLRG